MASIGDLQGDTQTHGENKECGHLTVSKQGKARNPRRSTSDDLSALQFTSQLGRVSVESENQESSAEK